MKPLPSRTPPLRTMRERVSVAQITATSVGGRNHYNIEDCREHGAQAHLSYLGGACVVCHQAKLVAQGLVKP